MITPVIRRRSKDIGQRIRAIVFHRAVHSLSALSDDQLDDEYVMKDLEGTPRDLDRPRAFWAVGRFGRDPDLHRERSPRRGRGTKSSGRRNFSLVDAVAKNEKLRPAAEIFRSEFWEFIAPRTLVPPTQERVGQIITILLEKKQLFRADDELANLADAKAINDPAFATEMSQAYKNSIRRLAAQADIDNLTLLSALYKEALSHTSLEQAAYLRKNVLDVAQRFLAHTRVEGLIAATFMELVEQRIIRGWWSPLEPRILEANIRGEFKDAVETYFMKQYFMLKLRRGSDDHTRPIVPYTATIRWLVDNKEQLINEIITEATSVKLRRSPSHTRAKK